MVLRFRHDTFSRHYECVLIFWNERMIRLASRNIFLVDTVFVTVLGVDAVFDNLVLTMFLVNNVVEHEVCLGTCFVFYIMTR